MTSNRNVSLVRSASERADDLRALSRLAESGALKPVIDRTYGFQHLPEAHAYVETGRKRGSVVVSMSPELRGPAKWPIAAAW